jgi:hypothetical protein
MLELIIIILLVLWLIGYFGPRRYSRIPSSSLIHVLLIIVVILVILRLLR